MPAPRIRFALVPFPDQRLMLFGGADGGSYPAFDDTWLWDGAAWHELSDDSVAPGALTAAAMDYTSDGLSLLFGGRAQDGSLSGRTFRWQGSRWLLQPTSTTRDIRNAAQKYDSGGLRVVDLDVEDVYVDIVDLAERVRATVDDAALDAAATALIAAVQGNLEQNLPPFVLYERHATHRYEAYDPNVRAYTTFDVNLDRAHGIGLFYPPRSTSGAESAYVAYIQHRLFDITRDSGWTRFISRGLPPQGPGDWDALSNRSLNTPLLPREHGFQEHSIYLPLIQR